MSGTEKHETVGSVREDGAETADERRDMESHYTPRNAQQFGAPRRFGIGTILVVMGAASILLATLVAWGAPAPVVFHIVAFLVLVAGGQVFLFQGQDPRRASIVSGAVICPVYMLGLMIFLSVTAPFNPPLGEMLLVVFLSTLFGPLFGYLAGGVVGGVFLIMDRWEQRFGRRAVVEDFDPFAPVVSADVNSPATSGFHTEASAPRAPRQ